MSNWIDLIHLFHIIILIFYWFVQLFLMKYKIIEARTQRQNIFRATNNSFCSNNQKFHVHYDS